LHFQKQALTPAFYHVSLCLADFALMSAGRYLYLICFSFMSAQRAE
jgi:hypothetical protein